MEKENGLENAKEMEKQKEIKNFYVNDDWITKPYGENIKDLFMQLSSLTCRIMYLTRQIEELNIRTGNGDKN